MDEEELILNDTLIKKCEEEGIVIALVAINRETKEIDYYVCYCHKDKKGKYIIQKIEETDL